MGEQYVVICIHKHVSKHVILLEDSHTHKMSLISADLTLKSDFKAKVAVKDSPLQIEPAVLVSDRGS